MRNFKVKQQRLARALYWTTKGAKPWTGKGEAWAQIKAEAQVETEDYRTLNEMNNC